MSELVALDLGRVAHLELVDPPLNLITRAMLEELGDALAVLAAAPADEVRAVVVTGRGERAFSAGSHVGEFEAQRGAGGRERLELEARVSRALGDLPMPTIAAIEGDALGGGLELALACDLRICSSRARLGLPEVRLAVIPGAGGTQRLPRVVGPARARELILTGRIIDAAEASRIGLVSEVVPAGEARARADAVAERDRHPRAAGRPGGQAADRRGDRARPGRRARRRAGSVGAHLRNRRPARGRDRVLREARPEVSRPVRPTTVLRMLADE